MPGRRFCFEFMDPVSHLLKGFGQTGNVTTHLRELIAQPTIQRGFSKVSKLLDWQKDLSIQERTNGSHGKNQDHTAKDDHAVLQLAQSLLEGILGNADIEGPQETLLRLE